MNIKNFKIYIRRGQYIRQPKHNSIGLSTMFDQKVELESDPTFCT